MKKILAIFLTLFVVTPVFIIADSNTHTIKGTINIPKKGQIYIILITEEQYEEQKGQESKFRCLLTIGPEELKSNQISFTISNIPSGRYCLTCFQDLNGNGKLDKGLFGPVEPWAMYKPPQGALLGRPSFKDICVVVVNDISGIKIELK